jgi:hypothetical protein
MPIAKRAVNRREIVIHGIEHKRVQLAAANTDITAGEKRQQDIRNFSFLSALGKRYVNLAISYANLFSRRLGHEPVSSTMDSTKVPGSGRFRF